MHCDVCAENVQPKLPRPAIPRQVLDFNEQLGLGILSLPHWDGFPKSVQCLNIVCHSTLFQMIFPLWSGTTALDLRQAYREGWQRWARDPKQVVLDPAGENLHDIFLDPLELNSVETEVTAAESPWQAGITEANGRAFKMVVKKMLDQRSRKTRESMKSALMRLCQPETSFSEPMGSVHINMCSDEILSWLSMFWCLELTWPR